MTPYKIRELLADHYTDVAPTGTRLTAIDVKALREAWSAILVNDYDSTHIAVVDDAIQVLAALDREEATMRFLSDWRNARSPQERTEAAFKVAASLETDVLGGSLGRAGDGEET